MFNELFILWYVKNIELKLGRKQDSHLQPREIDIDIELYEGYVYHDDVIDVPHPELQHRKFLLEPFRELAPTIVHPLLKKTVNELYVECPDTHAVVRTHYSLTT